MSYGRYRTLQHRRFRRRRGREHRHDRRAECGPRPISRSAHRRSVRAGGGSVVGALAGLLRRRRASRRLSHAVARRARAALPASPRAVAAGSHESSPRGSSSRPSWRVRAASGGGTRGVLPELMFRNLRELLPLGGLIAGDAEIREGRRSRRGTFGLAPLKRRRRSIMPQRPVVRSRSPRGPIPRPARCRLPVGKPGPTTGNTKGYRPGWH